ncbi:MAG: hypothetical protein WCJ56_12710 [bacterium]
MKNKNRALTRAIGSIVIAFIVVSLIPVRMGISDDRNAFDRIELLPGERWYLVEYTQVSDAIWLSTLNSENTDNIYFTELTGDDPWPSFRRSFAYEHTSGGGRNKYLMIGKIERYTYPDSKYNAVLNVRKWYVISPVNRLLGPPWYLNIFDVKLTRGFL